MRATRLENPFSHKPPHRRRGAAAVEFAIVLPILILLLLGGADLGRCFYSAMAVTNSARAGAEYGAMNRFDAATLGNWQARVQQAATDELSESTLFDLSKVTVTANGIIEADGSRRVEVHVTYPFKTLFSWLTGTTTLTLQQTAVMRVIR